MMNSNYNFFDKVNEIICMRISKDESDLKSNIAAYAKMIASRAIIEKKQILDEKIKDIKKLSREEAIDLLVEQERKKTDQMDKLINKLNGGEEE